MFWRVGRSSAFWPLRARISKFTYTTYISSTCIYTHMYSLTLSDILIVYTMSYSGVYIGRVHFGHSEHGYQHSHAQRIYRRHVFTNRCIHLHNVIVFFNTMSYSGVYVGRAHFCHSEHGYQHSNTQCIYHRHVLAYTYVRVHNVIFYIYVFIYITTCVFIHHVTFRCVHRSGAFLPLQAHQSKFTLTMLTWISIYTLWYMYVYTQCDFFYYTMSCFWVYIGRVHPCHSEHTHDRFCWKYYNPKIYQFGKLRFLGTNSNWTWLFSMNLNCELPRNFSFSIRWILGVASF